MKGLDLMRTMRFAVAIIVGALLLSGCTEKPKVLRLYNWFEYVSPEVVAAFEAKYDCKVEVTNFDDNEAMMERLRTDGVGDFDIIVPSTYMIGQMVKERMIVPIDHTRCPSVRRNFPREYVRMVPDDTELKYAVPYGISHSGLLCATNRIPKGVSVDSWAALGNPVLKGHIFLLEDMREIFALALMYQGHSVNTEDKGEIEAAADQILRWCPNVGKWDEDDSLFENDDGTFWVWLAYGDTANNLLLNGEGLAAKAGLTVSCPKEGCLFSCEEMTISSGCRNADLAYAFIEFLYSDSGIGIAHMKDTGCLLPSAPALEAMSPELRRLLLPSPEVLSRGQVLEGFDGKPEVQALYERVWERIVRER